jgi:hypothetical protein
MPKEKAKKPEKITDSQFERWWDNAEDGRSDYDWKWFIYDLWVSGNHYVKWDKDTQQITSSVPDKGHPKIVINKIYSTLRSVRNFALRNRPRAEVTPENLQPENIQDAVKLNRFLDFLHDKLKMRTKQRSSIWHALKYSVGWWQVLWDEDEKEIDVNVVDPFDLYIDSTARSPEEARYMFLAVRRNIEDINADPKYRDYIKKKKIELRPDGKLAASSMKERMMNIEKTGEVKSASDKNNTIIVKELWYKKYDEDTGKQTICIMAKAGETTIRESEETDLTRFPFFRLPSDVDPLKMYGQGWVKNLISPNKLLNQLESQVAEYNDLMNRGKWVSDRGAGVRTINNNNGQIIEKKRGFDVIQASISPLSAAIFKQIENASIYMEDLGGAHDATMGRIPTGAKSGKALEALQVGDSNNLSEVVENLEEFLEAVYEYILELISKKYQFARRIITTTGSGEKEFIEIIGSEAKGAEGESIAPSRALVVEPKNMVDVKITSWLAETQEARRDALIKLFELQAIDLETLLQGYAIGNVAQVIQRVQGQQEKQMAMDTAQQVTLAKAQQPPPEAPTPPPPQVGPAQANAALQAVIQGQEPEVPKDVTPEYLGYIDQFMQSDGFANLDDNDKQAVQAFRLQIAQLIR